MPRVHHIRANKDYPAEGIKKGEHYFKWSTRTTAGKSYIKRIHRSSTCPRASQLTGSEYLSQAHQLNERIEDFDETDFQELEAFRDEIKSEAESLREEQQDKLANMPDHLQYAPTGEIIQERIDALEAFESELDSLDVPSDQPGEEPEEDDFEEEEDFEQEHSEWTDLMDEWESVITTFKETQLEVG